MKILFDLIKSLNKEEKRLYRLHGREVKFRFIYDVYVKAKVFNRNLDKQVYEEKYADVSKSFYSAQKRELMDDILSVLLEFSNRHQAGYAFERFYSKAAILMFRDLTEGAMAYLDEANLMAEQSGDAANRLRTNIARQHALLKSEKPSLVAYEVLLSEHDEIQAKQGSLSKLDILVNCVNLLLVNHDGISKRHVEEKATNYLKELKNYENKIDSQESWHKFIRLELTLHQVLNQQEEAHKLLISVLKLITPANFPPHLYYDLLAEQMFSSLHAGDFLLPSSIIYKTEKIIHQLPEDLQKSFLPKYYEAAALYHFYENDLPEAIREINLVIQLNPDQRTVVRCFAYKLAMLVAGDLHLQMANEIQNFRQTFGDVDYKEITTICTILADINRQIEFSELSNRVEKELNLAKKHQATAFFISALEALSQFFESKKQILEPNLIMPEDWLQILRVDLWLQAKFDRSFYYNLIHAEWMKKRKVF